MSKYNFTINGIDPESTHGRILSKIKTGSNVLECGCASGYMTQFMHEKLDCDVHIVEIDQDACDKAKAFASDWYCGNLSENGWHQYYFGKQYDYILFADVLEHLINPADVLKKASELLKPDGRIIVSIPNICHNDIIIRLYYDLFSYTDMGLLDNTHIHFWGIRDFISMCDAIGLHAEECNCVLRQTGHTEQALPLSDVEPALLEVLNKRDFGEAYQYVFTIKKKE